MFRLFLLIFIYFVNYCGVPLESAGCHLVHGRIYGQDESNSAPQNSSKQNKLKRVRKANCENLKRKSKDQTWEIWVPAKKIRKNPISREGYVYHKNYPCIDDWYSGNATFECSFCANIYNKDHKICTTRPKFHIKNGLFTDPEGPYRLWELHRCIPRPRPEIDHKDLSQNHFEKLRHEHLCPKTFRKQYAESCSKLKLDKNYSKKESEMFDQCGIDFVSRNTNRSKMYQHLACNRFKIEDVMKIPIELQLEFHDRKKYQRRILKNHPDPLYGLEKTIKWISGDPHPYIYWYTDESLGLLRNAKSVLCDGTFRIVPKLNRSKFQFTQLYVIAGLVEGPLGSQYYPLFSALMPRKSLPCYKRVFQHIRDEFDRIWGPGVECNFDTATLITDYESAAINAIKSIFEHIKITGCLFHWKQSLFRWAASRHPLKQMYERKGFYSHRRFREFGHWIGLITALALIRPSLVVETWLNVVKKQRPLFRIARIDRLIKKFCNHIEKNWLKINVSFDGTMTKQTGHNTKIQSWNHWYRLGLASRTNNWLEGSFGNFRNRLDHFTHPSLSVFIEEWQLYMAETKNQWRDLRDGFSGSRQMAKWQINNQNLKSAKDNLRNDLDIVYRSSSSKVPNGLKNKGEWGFEIVYKYLKRVSHLIGSGYYQNRNQPIITKFKKKDRPSL